MLEYDFPNSIGHWICMASHDFERAMNGELTPQGITWRQCQALAWLALEGELVQVALAERLNIEPATLVRILDRMERDGLIVRRDCTEDRRRKVIAASPKAVDVWQRIVASAHRVRARATRGISSDELNLLRDLLQRVRDNLSRSEALPESA